MKIAAMTIVLLITGALAQVKANVEASERKVIVCIDRRETFVPVEIIPAAQTLASRIFADIGVTIKWRGLPACPAQGIRITLSQDTPETLERGALAYALPYEGIHISVFYDRIARQYNERRIPAVLGHVLAHEITHILEGIRQHSASGIMKAWWDYQDLADMAWKPLGFEAHDVDLIYSGLAWRMNGMPAARVSTQSRNVLFSAK